MSTQDMITTAKELRELKRMQEELQAEITTLEDAIKAAMGESEQVIAGEYKRSPGRPYRAPEWTPRP